MGGRGPQGYRDRVSHESWRSLVFIDLDTTPGQDDESAVRRAGEQVKCLAGEGALLVPCSLRTRAQLERALRAHDLHVPFIVEGGSAACVPVKHGGSIRLAAGEGSAYDRLEFGPVYGQVVRTLRSAAARLAVAIRSFSDMTVEEVATAQGMPLLAARLAMHREHSEPFMYADGRGSDAARLVRALHTAGLRVREHGGWSYAGGTMSYQPAVRALRQWFARQGFHVSTTGLGSADGWLRDAVDQYVVLPPDGAESGGTTWII